MVEVYQRLANLSFRSVLKMTKNCHRKIKKSRKGPCFAIYSLFKDSAFVLLKEMENVNQGCEKGITYQQKVCERATFSIKNVIQEGKGLYLGAPPPLIGLFFKILPPPGLNTASLIAYFGILKDKKTCKGNLRWNICATGYNFHSRCFKGRNINPVFTY